MAVAHCDVLLFDVFGTVVDWSGSVSSELSDWSKSTPHSLPNVAPLTSINWLAFTQAWRKGYYTRIIDMATNGNPRKLNLDQIHREILDELIEKSDNQGLKDAWDEDVRTSVNMAWHRLNPWADSSKGLDMLKREFKIGTLTNGTLELMINLAKHGSLPWDFILTSDLLGSFKPDPEMYRKGISLNGLDPSSSQSARRVALVAAHLLDLQAAKSCGMTTVFIQRPTEDQLGEGEKPDYVDLVCKDLEELGRIAGGLPMA